jgi:hypothetical protein
MLTVGAHTAGEHSTLDMLIGVAIVIGALAAVNALARRLSRLAREHRQHQPAASIPTVLSGRRERNGTDQTTSTAPAPVSTPASPELKQTAGAAAIVATSASVRRDARDDLQARFGPAAIPGSRHSPQTLQPLAEHVDNSRRLRVAEARVGDVLAALPDDRWYVEPYVLFAGHRIPFLILGETGVFALWPLAGRAQWRELPFATEMSAHVKRALPGYPGPVHAGLCRTFAPDAEPRWWCPAGHAGVWIMGLNWTIRWLEHFGPDHGLGTEDLQQLRAQSGPRWGHPVTHVPPTAHIPDID